MSPRRAAVLGSPVAHSLSPRLHLAAYRELGLLDWTYDRIECTAEELPGLVAAMGPEWVGLSVTMPGKFAALRAADECSERAERVGSANTLVRVGTRWRADNTDIDGVAGALGGLGGLRRALVLGSGGTAPAAVAALAGLGVLELGEAVGVRTRYQDLGAAGLTAAAARTDVVVSTLPADTAAGCAAALRGVPVLLDAIYDPWPTPLARAVAEAGGQVIGGRVMLLHQALGQVEQFTGRPAPRAQMAAALD